MTESPHRSLPAGFVSLSVGDVLAASAEQYAESIETALRSRAGTLHDYARLHFESKPLAGRGIAYSAPLPETDVRVVVRHNRHGGLLAPMTRDLFIAPTRAPAELNASLRLARAGVPTPEFVAYATYPAPLLMRRVDVATREIPESFDLSEALTRANASVRSQAWNAVAELLRQLAVAGARHHDLNVKNVLLRQRGHELEALALDVDRVTFGSSDVMAANMARLLRSARKWRRLQGAAADESELAAFERSVLEAPDPAATRS